MKLFLLFFLITSLCLSCTRSPPYEKAGYTSINKHIKTMCELEQWLPQSIGGSFYDDDIKVLNVSFIVTAETFDIDLFRSLMVKGVEIFLTSINTNDQTISHLNHFPFTYNDIKYGISLYSPLGKWLGHAFLLDGDLVYFKTIHPASAYQKRTEQVYEEPYPEALQKVKAGLIAPVPQLPTNPI